MARGASRGGRAVRAGRAERRVRRVPDSARIRATGLTTTKYDDVDWHVDAVVTAGLPEENAFAHIGLYLGWLIRRDLVDQEMFVEDHLAAVKSGEMTGSDLADVVDGKLVSDSLTSEGTAFTDSYYEHYLSEYGDAFPGRADYEVTDDLGCAAVVSELLDRRLDEWRAAGRPESPHEPARSFKPLFKNMANHDSGSSGVTLGIGRPPPGSTDPGTERLVDETLRGLFPGAKFVEVQPPAPPHDAPGLEALFPTNLTPGPVLVTSTSASKWRDSVLNKVLKQLGVEPADAMVANAMCGRGRGMLTMQITSIPGVDRSTLWSLLSRLEKVSGGRCDDRRLADRRVRWCTYAEFGVKATWTVDGLVIWASARDAHLVESAIAGLP